MAKKSPLEPHIPGGASIREIVFGIEDGLISLLGLALGMAGATGDSKLVVLSGSVAIVAEAFSMGAGAYLSSKAQREYYESEIEREKYEIEHVPKIETKEIRDIYYAKGFRGKELESIVKMITSDKERWLNIMMEEELKIFPEEANPIKDTAVMVLSSAIGGLFPLIPFLLLPVSTAVYGAIIATLIVLFLLGVAKTFLTHGDWKRSGLEMAAIGSLAAIVGYVVGLLVKAPAA